jgi:hypothetical protein
MAMTKATEFENDGSHGESLGGLPFNSPLESGLRLMCVLYEAFPASYDLQRLVFLDYLVVHSGDVSDGPDSLHPPTPFRSNEFLVRRKVIERGLRLLLERGLVDVQPTTDGFLFQASELAAAFVQCLQEPYTATLRERARWTTARFGQSSENELADFFNRHLDRWGAEFEIVGDIE